MKTRDLIYEYICSYFEQHGYVPRNKEICEKFYLHTASVSFHLNNLVECGLLVTDDPDGNWRCGQYRPAGYKVVKEDA